MFIYEVLTFIIKNLLTIPNGEKKRLTTYVAPYKYQ